MSSNREFVVEVIELYKEHTCLWKVTDPHYHDKNKRNQAKEMACYCQKMINDAIFLAETNTLSVTSRIVNDPVPVFTPAVSKQPAPTPSTLNPSNPVMEAYLNAVHTIEQYDYQ